ncbi:SGNH/GDSL hydrolase family protein [Pseudomonas marginalis]|uniref:SGNH/GDSL hydrolase family protein n=1 Tax=Pseudomonas TaxID=286 RepID=UPI00389ADBC4
MAELKIVAEIAGDAGDLTVTIGTETKTLAEWVASIGIVTPATPTVPFVEHVDSYGAKPPALVDFSDTMQNGAAASGKIQLRGSAAAIVSGGLLSVVAPYTEAGNTACIPRYFAEGRLTFRVKRGAFMLGYHVNMDGNGWQLWSATGGALELGYISTGGSTIYSAMTPTVALPGAVGDLINVEVETGPVAPGAPYAVRVWADGAPRPTSPSGSGTYPADSAGGSYPLAEGYARIASFGATPVVVKSVLYEDAAPVVAQSAFIGRWKPTYEGGVIGHGSTRQGSSLRFKVSGATAVSIRMARSGASTQDPVMAVRLNGGPWSYVPISVAGVSTYPLASGLSPASAHTLEVAVAGTHESDPKWRRDCGLNVIKILAGAGQVAPWADNRPALLFIGDSIVEGICAKGTPSLPANSCGERVFGRLIAESLGWQPVINGFGGTGLAVAGSGGFPDAPTSVFNYQHDRPVRQEHVQAAYIQIGTNDTATASTWQALLVTLVCRIKQRYPGVVVFLARPFNGKYEAQVIAAATATGSTYLDTTGMTVAADFTDGTHLTEAGHAKVAIPLAALMAPAIQA